ncbi:MULTISPECIES: spore coat protein [Bacillaceae]|uniref:spore coat protein n=1 Tax=Bacillaceae TaxID=186817 RepID=UPI000BFE470D|nr:MULTISPECIES: spore coat protein [Bacillaceae]PGT78104.1 spore coat protein [Bacillus sp. AFS040349]UGB31838.1 spore coat protein [Metabacillus sp. B2-18]
MQARPYEWVALDRHSCHPTDCHSKNEVAGANVGNFFDDDATVSQNAAQVSETEQISSETIIVRDSCDIDISSTDTQVAVSLQVALQVAIALVINLTIADSNRAEQVTQQLIQQADMKQLNKQKLVIENSKDVKVTTTDTDVAISLQVLLQILIALVVNIDIF